MAKLASIIISEVKGEFEGGSALDVNWNYLLQQTAETVLENITPATLQRSTPIYEGLAKESNVFYCPNDVLAPVSLDSPKEDRSYEYKLPKDFYNTERDCFTIEYVNGVRYLLSRHSEMSDLIVINKMEEVGDINGDPDDIAVNKNKYITGEASIEATFTTFNTNIKETLDTPLDISEHITDGRVVLPVYIENGSEINSIEIYLKTDDSNYYRFVFVVDNNLKDQAWNFVPFKMEDVVVNGSPDPSNITSWTLAYMMADGASQKILTDRISIENKPLFKFRYFSDRMFIDGSTGMWKDTVQAENYDKVNLDKFELGIFHYELCKLVSQNSSEANENEKRFDNQLTRKYQQYEAENPSSQKLVTYNVMPDVPFDHDVI